MAFLKQTADCRPPSAVRGLRSFFYESKLEMRHPKGQVSGKERRTEMETFVDQECEEFCDEDCCCCVEDPEGAFPDPEETVPEG